MRIERDQRGHRSVAHSSQRARTIAGSAPRSHLQPPAAATRLDSREPGGTRILTSGGALNGPLGLILAPDGDLIAVSGGNGNSIETTPRGRQVATVPLARHGAGDLFGVTTPPGGQGMPAGPPRARRAPDSPLAATVTRRQFSPPAR